MGKVVRKIKAGLQLNHKWVRVMLSVSVVVILGIIIYPNRGMKYSKSVESINEAIMDTTIVMPDSSTARVVVRRQPMSIDRPLLSAPAPAIESGEGIEGDVKSNEPLQVQIVETDKPFDWKGTLTWIIGAINGLVLLVLNLKNIFKKT